MIDFEATLIKNEKMIFNYAYNLTKDYNEAQDLLQETYYKALNYRDKYTEDTNFKGWIFTIVRNLFINDYRKKTRERLLFDTTEESYYINSIESETISPEGLYTINEITNFINNNIKGTNKTAFIMFLNGFKYNEIAEHLDLPLGTIKSKIFGVRKTLQEHFKDCRFNNY